LDFENPPQNRLDLIHSFMKKTFLFLALFYSFFFLFCSCQNEISTITDARDQQIYRYQNIEGKDWMLDNLSFKSDSSWCFNNEKVNCEVYGQLYTWYDALKACPEGWRLPTQEEWMDLSLHLAGEEWHKNDGGQNRLYRKLRVDSGNDFILPLAGMYDPAMDLWWPTEKIGSYWSSTPFAFHAAVCAVVDKKQGEMFMINPGTRTVGHSCRCVRGSDE